MTSWKLHHIGVVVKDVDKAVEHYQSLGIGPFQAPTPLDRVGLKINGKPVDLASIKFKVRFADMGPVRIELIQPVEGESLVKDFLETRGEGISHLGITVDNINEVEAKLVNKGFTVPYRSTYKNGGGAAYIDTDKIGGVLVEILQY